MTVDVGDKTNESIAVFCASIKPEWQAILPYRAIRAMLFEAHPYHRNKPPLLLLAEASAEKVSKCHGVDTARFALATRPVVSPRGEGGMQGASGIILSRGRNTRPAQRVNTCKLSNGETKGHTNRQNDKYPSFINGGILSRTHSGLQTAFHDNKE